LQRSLERVEISNLTEEDDVWILTKHAPQRLREAAGVRSDFTLVDVAAVVAVQELDRIFNRDDVRVATLVDVLDHRRERRRFAGAGDPRDEHESARTHGDL